MADTAARFVVRGHVQGVGFRASTRERAIALGLRGVACNRGDGSVAVTAAGNAPALDALERWLHDGPPAARVDSVLRTGVDGDVAPGFRTA